MDFDDDILSSFVEDAHEHLAGIESCLMDLEQAGEAADPELVNTVFRAAHSIKGGASFLGLDTVRDLSHKLENVLHMMRSGEMVPDPAIVSILLEGFDLLRALVERAHEGNGHDISGILERLQTQVEASLPPSERDRLGQGVRVPLPQGGTGFSLDRLSLEQALHGGKHLYLVEYDLIHDVHARGKTPLDIFAVMESSGLVLDCLMDLGAVGDLDSPLTNKIPFFLLYATIVEPDVVGYLFALDASRIREVDPASLLSPDDPPQGTPLQLELAGEADHHTLAEFKASLLDALQSGRDVSLNLARATGSGTALVQFLCAAHRSFAARGRTLCLSGTEQSLNATLDSLGFDRSAATRCGIAHCPLNQGGTAS